MPLVELWMRFAVCRAFPDLPWLSDKEYVSYGDEIGMRAACRSCGVFETCHSFVQREQISAGFWAGEFRDPEPMDGAA